MAEKGQVEFPFNIEDFNKMVEKMGDSLNTISKKVDGFGKTMEKSVVKGLTKATAMMGLFVKGFKSVMKNMPEIGQAFKMASDIMAKEFFFPIRQQIMPYLQKMLDWTRDHRTLFAKWGQSVAQIVKTVIDVGKQLWDVFKNVTTLLTESLQKGIGTSFKSIDEFINVLSVKIAVITMYLGDLVESLFGKISPTFEYIVEKGAEILKFFSDLVGSWLTLNKDGASLGTVLDKIYDIFDKIVHIIGDSLSSFFEGLIQPLKNIMSPLDSICDSFKRLLDIFGDDNSGIKSAFSWLGNFVGNQLLAGFEGLAIAIDTIVLGIQTLAQSGNLLKDLFTGDWSALSNDWKVMGSIFTEYGSRTASHAVNAWDAMKGSVGIDDGIVTKDGKVIQLNPSDNIYAFKGAVSYSHSNENNKESHLNLANNKTSFSAPMTVTINITASEGDAQVIGQQIGVSLHQSFSDRVKEQMMAGGY